LNPVSSQSKFITMQVKTHHISHHQSSTHEKNRQPFSSPTPSTTASQLTSNNQLYDHYAKYQQRMHEINAGGGGHRRDVSHPETATKQP
jgi:hypothetical protein